MANIDSKIIISKNNKNDYNDSRGLKIIGKKFSVYRHILNPGNSNAHYNLPEFSNSETMKNKIILSYKFIAVNTLYNYNLITKYNLKNNIKHFYYYKNGTRIIFTKSNVPFNDDLYLLNISGVNSFVKINNKNIILTTTSSNKHINVSLIELNYNFYNKYKNSDYYNFKFRDFIDLSNILKIPSTETYNNDYQITYNNIELSNNFLDNSYINYNISDFQTIYCLSDNSVNILNPSDFNDISDNILIYNKLNNNTIINVDYKKKKCFIN